MAKEKATVNRIAKMADSFGVESETIQEKVTLPSNDTATKIDTSAATTTTAILSSDQSKKSIRPITPIIEPKKLVEKEINFDDSDDILQDLGFDPKHTRTPTGSTRKTNIIDDLLDFSKSSRDTSKLETPKTGQVPADSSAEKPANTDTTTSIYRPSPTSGRPRTATGTTTEYSANDPLGFFSTATKKASTIKNDESPIVKKANKSAAVGWLGINLDKEIAVDSLAMEINDQTQPVKYKKSETIATVATAIERPAAEPYFDPPTNSAHSLHQLDITTVHNEGALQSLRQQQNQL